MIDDLKPYDSHKDSRLPWLGQLPSHWEIRRNGRLFRQRNETGFPDLPILEVSLKTGVRIRDFENSTRKQVMSDRDKYKRARQGDIAYNMMRMWQGAVGVAPVDGLISPAYVVAQPLPDTLPRYYEYLFRIDDYKNEVNKFSRGIVSDRNRLYWEDFKQMPSPFPPPEEQDAIVRFLDHVDRRIRRYIRSKRRLIALLNEQKQAIIHRAVTRGLDPNVRLKPSGIESFGNVPNDWEVVPFKRHVGFQEGPGIMAADFRNEGIPLLRISCLRGDVASLEGCNFLDPEMVARRWSHFAVQTGDYLLSASASTGAVVYATEIVAGAIPYTGIIRLWPLTSSVHMPFIRLFMGTRLFQDQIDAAKSGVAIEHFGPSHLKRMQIVLPPVDLQQKIVAQLEDLIRPFAPLITATNEQIERVSEYHTRLIADVVTGKLDVRDAVSRLPDEVDEPDASLDELFEDGESVEDPELDAEPEEVEA